MLCEATKGNVINRIYSGTEREMKLFFFFFTSCALWNINFSILGKMLIYNDDPSIIIKINLHYISWEESITLLVTGSLGTVLNIYHPQTNCLPITLAYSRRF